MILTQTQEGQISSLNQQISWPLQVVLLFFFWSGGFRPLLVSPVRLSLGEGPQDRSLSKCKVSHHQPHLKFMCRQASVLEIATIVTVREFHTHI